MKTAQKFMIVLAFALSMVSVATAQTRGVGLGAYVQGGNPGENGGLNMKLFLSSRHALDLSLSVEPDPFGESMGAYASYLLHFWDVIPMQAGKLPLYMGPNAGIGVWNDHGDWTEIRLGGVFGMAFCMPQGTVPMDFFLQINPVFPYIIEPGDGNDGFEPGIFLQLGLRFFLN